ncbi:hypothetical protein EAF04_006830 [Stromatinia cepivora]|nr:hypothetical protein EAF04_006830 [Stromatinia cepivora]
MSPSLDIPQAGLKLESNPPSNKSATNITPAIGLTLSDGMIEDMIKCFQNGKPIELSLGGSPNLIYGNKSHILSTYHDPFQYEVFQTADPHDTTSDMLKSQTLSELKLAHKKFSGPGAQPRYKADNLKASKKPALAAAGEDTALENLRESMATAQAKKDGNTTKIINQVPAKRGAAKVTNKSKFLNKGLGSDANRSMPVSPALSGLGSPAQGATKSLSQQQAEYAKSSRKPIVHLLALEPMTEKELNNRIPGPKDDLKQAMAKVGDLNTSTGKWELRKNYYKELDVFNFKYGSDAERQRAIDNAVKIFDKMRLGLSEPEWEKLLPKSERGTGKSLSKLQAQIANGPVAKSKSNGKNRDSGDEEDVFGDKMVSKVKTEAAVKSASGPPTTKTKKLSEKEAQTKRLLSKNPPKTAAATMKSKPAKKEADKPKSSAAKPLSSQFVSESDDEEVSAKKPQVIKAPIKKDKANSKRLRNEEMDSSDSSLPLSKKTKKDNINSHRVSDASQSSRPSSNSTTSSSNSFKGKANSPQKSSPLASSPPTNASDFENTSSGDRSSSSASPANHHTLSNTRNNRSPIHKRHQKSSSVASSVSSTSSTRHLRPGVLDLAQNYKTFYPIYLKLHNELATSKVKNPTEEENLLAMHERLSDLKRQILEGIIEE